MDELVLHPTPTAQWHALVNEAQLAAHCELGEELESYLVFLLMRFTQKPDMAAALLAMEYLESLQGIGSKHQDGLRNVGDQCLLFSGLFPHRAKRKRVKVTYFVDIGRSAYHQLANLLNHSSASIYNELAEGFVAVKDVLNAMRKLDHGQQTRAIFKAVDEQDENQGRVVTRRLSKSSFH